MELAIKRINEDAEQIEHWELYNGVQVVPTHKKDPAISNFSKNTRRQYLVLEMIRAAFTNVESMDVEVIKQAVFITRLGVTIQRRLVGSEKIKLAPRAYEVYAGVLKKLQKEMENRFPERTMTPLTVGNMLLYFVTMEIENGSENNRNMWNYLLAQLVKTFNMIQDTFPEYKDKPQWESHFALKGEFMGKTFLKIINA
jgi:hypothetical protein